MHLLALQCLDLPSLGLGFHLLVSLGSWGFMVFVFRVWGLFGVLGLGVLGFGGCGFMVLGFWV